MEIALSAIAKPERLNVSPVLAAPRPSDSLYKGKVGLNRLKKF